MTSQRDMVSASLLAEEQRAHHHDVYPRRRLGGYVQSTAGAWCQPRTSLALARTLDHVRQPVELDAEPIDPSRCPRCCGTGTIAGPNQTRWRCAYCGGTGNAPTTLEDRAA